MYAKRIKSDNFTRSNREKFNIAILIYFEISYLILRSTSMLIKVLINEGSSSPNNIFEYCDSKIGLFSIASPFSYRSSNFAIAKLSLLLALKSDSEE